MAFDLSATAGRMRYGSSSWSFLLALARQCGWQPAGPKPPRRDADGSVVSWDVDENGEPIPHDDDDGWWHGIECYRRYFFNDYQWVTAEDASNLADALERAIDDLPNHDALEHKTVKVAIGGGCQVRSIRDGASVLPFEFFSGRRKDWVREFIAYCRAGEFCIG